MDFHAYLQLVRACYRLLLAAVAAGVLTAGLVTASLPPTFTASSQVLFTGSARGDGQDLAFAGGYVQSRMATYQGLATARETLDPVVAGLHLSGSSASLRPKVTAAFTPGTMLMTITVKDHGATEAQATALKVGESLIDRVETLERAPAAEEGGVAIKVVKGAVVTAPERPSSPSSPSYLLNVTAGALLGLIVGLAGALIRRFRAMPRAPVLGAPVVPASLASGALGWPSDPAPAAVRPVVTAGAKAQPAPGRKRKRKRKRGR